jgi:hypothetical protein
MNQWGTRQGGTVFTDTVQNALCLNWDKGGENRMLGDLRAVNDYLILT